MIFWFIVLCALYGGVMLHPDAYMFSDSGDGIKNYFTFAWHVRYDTDWLVFGGMNYPNGEHVCYTDGHPLLSLFLGWLPFVQAHPVAVINVFMLLGLFVLPLTIYRFFREVGVSYAVAVVGALCLAWLNPQLNRLQGHYALSYAWVVPLAMLCVLQLYRNPGVSKMFNLLVLTIGVYFIHPYLGMCISLLAVGVFCLKPLFECTSWKTKWREWIFGVLGAVLPLAVYLLFVKATDTHIMRAPDAKGFLEYTSSLKSIFLPNSGFFLSLFSSLFHPNQAHWEGCSFVGTSSLVLLVLALSVGLKTALASWKEDRFWPILLLSGVVIAAFALGIPFVWNHQDWLHKVPYLEQFRAPGRFAWVFYYALGCWLWFLLCKWTAKFSVTKSALVLGALLLIAAADGYEAQNRVAKSVKNANLFSERNIQLEDLDKIDELTSHESPKAILPIPFFHYGSDYYVCGGNEEAKKKAYVCAYLSGVSLFASANPRVSLQESRNHLQFLSDAYAYKNMWDSLPEGTALYLLRCGDPILPYEKSLWESDMRWLKPEFEKPEWEERIQTLNDVALNQDAPFVFDPITGFVDTGLVKVNLNNAEALGNEYIVLYETTSSSLQSHLDWQASVCLEWSQLNALYTSFVVEETVQGKSEWVSFCGANQSVDTYNGMVIARLPFTPKENAAYKFLVKGSDDYPAPYKALWFALQPKGMVLVEPGQPLVVNGISLPKVR